MVVPGDTVMADDEKICDRRGSDYRMKNRTGSERTGVEQREKESAIR